MREAARDGVDVRLLVPGSSDVPVLQPIVRAGYRSLIEAGIRVFEWNGPMLHAKTAVADGRWSRVGSTNLNLASWATNWELDVVVEDEDFGAAMEAMYLEDLANADRDRAGRGTTPARADADLRPRAGRLARARARPSAASPPAPSRLGNTVGTRHRRLALAHRHRGAQHRDDRRRCSSARRRPRDLFPVLVVAPLVITLVWFGVALLVRAFRLRGRSARTPAPGAGARVTGPESFPAAESR